MRNIGNFLLLVLLILTGIWFYRRHEEKKRLQRELEEKLLSFVKSKIQDIREAERQFSRLLKVETGYFSNYQLKVWQANFSSLFADLKDKPFDKVLIEKS